MAVAAITAVALAALGVWLFGDVNQPTQAGGPITVGFDMDPSSAPANSCPNDGTNCALGSIESCVQLPSGGGPVEFDVYLEGLPANESLAGGSYHIGEMHNMPLGSISAITHAVGLVNLWAQPGSSMMDLSDPLGTGVPSFDASVADTGAAEHNPPFTHGTLGRYTLSAAGLPDGIYGLTLDSVIMINHGTADLCSIYGCDVRDALGGYGLIAVGVECPKPADLKKVSLAAGLANGTKIPVCENVQFTLTEVLHNNGPNVSVVGQIKTRCEAPLTTPPSHCSYTPREGDSPDGQLWVGGPSIGTKRVPQDIPYGTKIEDTWLWVIQRKVLPVSIQITLSKDWDVHCGAPGTQTWKFSNSVVPDDPWIIDPVLDNNSKSLDLTLECQTPTATPTATPTPTPFPPPTFNPDKWNATQADKTDLTDALRRLLANLEALLGRPLTPEEKRAVLVGLVRGLNRDSLSAQYLNNCYNYACNTRTDTFAQPGRAATPPQTLSKDDLKDCKKVVANAIADGMTNFDEDCSKVTCPEGKHRKALVVNADGKDAQGNALQRDYHWYREAAANGTWSHKPGMAPATNKSEVPGDTNATIDNVDEVAKDAKQRGYELLCGCFCCNNDPSKNNKK